jgi:hypothetical protein
MFGFFRRKMGEAAFTSIAAEVGGVLQAQHAMPPNLCKEEAATQPECNVLHLRGDPPIGEWSDEAVYAETRSVFVVPAAYGQPKIAILSDAHCHNIRLWELSTDTPPRFLRERPAQLCLPNGPPHMCFPLAASFLPGGNVALEIAYTDPAMRGALYLYSPGTNEFHRIDQVQAACSARRGPHNEVETLMAASDAKLVICRNGLIRLRAEVYCTRHNHILLFSPRYPQGLEVIRLGLDDGNLGEYAMQGTTLWMNTHDIRNPPKDYIWSLDLHRVL